MNGTTCLKSRNLTFSDVNQRPTPKLAKNAMSINNGRKMRLTEGTVLYQISKANINTSEIKKSTRLVITDEAGMIILGKYTFEINLSLPTRLLLASDKPVEKNCH